MPPEANQELIIETVNAIEAFRDDNGYLPTIRELAERLELTSTPVYIRLQNAVKAGLLVKRNGHYIPKGN